MPEWIVSLLHFRNLNHENWFLVSMVILALLIYVVFRCREARRILWWPAFSHAFVSVEAAKVVFWYKRSSDFYSTDCVWFNALMFGIYMILFAIFKKHSKEEKR